MSGPSDLPSDASMNVIAAFSQCPKKKKGWNSNPQIRFFD